jgi:acetyl esterase/lipase
VIGSINTHRDLVARLARAAQTRALVIDYRLAPEQPHPAALEDATAAYRWLLASGADPARLAVAGDSAGGGLTVATLLALRDAGDALPACAAAASPWLDLACSGASMETKAPEDPMLVPERLRTWAAMYAGTHDVCGPLVSPLYADLAGLPPLLLQVGEAEVLLDDSTRLAERARAAGVDVTLDVWPEMIHVWHLFAFMLPEGQQAIDKLAGWIAGRVGGG